MSHTPRIVYYIQDHRQRIQGHKNADGPWQSMLPLAEPPRRTPYIILSSFHINLVKDPSRMFLNEELYNRGENNLVWEEVRELRSKYGVKVLGMFASVWELDKLASPAQSIRDYCYELLVELLTNTECPLDGIDLDIEPHGGYHKDSVDTDCIVDFVHRIRADSRIKKDLIITMAPTMYEMTFPTETGSSNVKYVDLYKKIGDEISWFNCQIYGTGGALNLGQFDTMVDWGFPPEKLNPAVAVNPSVGGWCDIDYIINGLKDIMSKYGSKIGGITAWDFMDAVLHKNDPDWASSPETRKKWAEEVEKVLFPNAVIEA